jgi:integrase
MEQKSRQVTQDHCRRLYRGHPGLRAEYTRHGKAIWVVRLPGVYHQMKSAPGTSAFWHEYADASRGLRAAPGPASETIGIVHENTTAWLVRQYLNWIAPKQGKGFSASKKKQHRTVLSHFIEKNGGQPYRRLDEAYIVKVRQLIETVGSNPDKPAPAPAQAQKFVSILSTMFDWAKSSEGPRGPNGERLVTSNPCRDIEKVEYETKDRNNWSDDTVARFEAYWRRDGVSREYLAFALLRHTGARCVDVVRMGWSFVDNGTMTFVPQKTRFKKGNNEVYVPIEDELQTVLDEAQAAGLLGTETFIGSQGNDKGAAVCAGAFSSWFSRACNEAGVPECTAHGLRHYGATRDAEDGWTVEALKKKYGFDDGKAAHYTQTAKMKREVERVATEVRERKRAKLRLVKAAA